MSTYTTRTGRWIHMMRDGDSVAVHMAIRTFMGIRGDRGGYSRGRQTLGYAYDICDSIFCGKSIDEAVATQIIRAVESALRFFLVEGYKTAALPKGWGISTEGCEYTTPYDDPRIKQTSSVSKDGLDLVETLLCYPITTEYYQEVQLGLDGVE